MAARGSKAQLVRIIAENETRLLYEAVLSPDPARALFFDWRPQHAHIKAQLSKLSIAKLKPWARHAKCIMGKRRLTAGAPAKPFSDHDLDFLWKVLSRAIKVGSVRSACHVIASKESKGRLSKAALVKRTSILKKRFRDTRKRWEAAEKRQAEIRARFRHALKRAMSFPGSG